MCLLHLGDDADDEVRDEEGVENEDEENECDVADLDGNPTAPKEKEFVDDDGCPKRINNKLCVENNAVNRKSR